MQTATCTGMRQSERAQDGSAVAEVWACPSSASAGAFALELIPAFLAFAIPASAGALAFAFFATFLPFGICIAGDVLAFAFAVVFLFSLRSRTKPGSLHQSRTICGGRPPVSAGHLMFSLPEGLF